MMEKLYLGIDAGGTSCKGRLVTANGTKLSEYKTGAANIHLGVDYVLKEVFECAKGCLHLAKKSDYPINALNVGIGMAGISHGKDLKQQMMKKSPFAAIKIKPDAYIACLSAHYGNDGAVLISGTGSIGYYIKDKIGYSLGGHGFMLGDQGSGANLGFKAIRQAVLAYDGFIEPSLLTQEIMVHFNNDVVQMLNWSKEAKPADYAQFSVITLDYFKKNDPIAKKLVSECLDDLSMILEKLYEKTQKPIGIVGGLGNALKPLLLKRYPDKIIEQPIDSLLGASLLARQLV